MSPPTRFARRLSAVFVALALASSCGSSSPTAPSASPPPPAPQGPPAGGGSRILFIGNSLTEYNDLPAMVQALLRRDEPAFTTRGVTLPGASLEDHWHRGDALRAIDEGGWSVVVLQQGPSSLPSSQAELLMWTRRFDQRIRAVGARTALYAVWPESARRGVFGAVHDSYARAADAVGGILCPAGEAWREVWRQDQTVALYGPDDFHPTPVATSLAALVIYQQITGRSPVGLPALVPMPGSTVTLLQESAATVNERVGRR